MNWPKRLTSKHFESLMFGLIVGKTGTFLLKRVLEKAIYTRLKLPHQGGGKLPPRFYPSTNLMKFTLQMNLACIFRMQPDKRTLHKKRNCGFTEEIRNGKLHFLCSVKKRDG